jgi:plastin-2
MLGLVAAHGAAETDTDGNGYISYNELRHLFKAACWPLPGYRVREIAET